MTRFALGVAYQGDPYAGWQRQSEEVRTVQAALENALSQVADHPIVVGVAGRTDAGVHAVGQVVAFSTAVERPSLAWTRGVNTYLPSDIRVHWVREVPEGFDARRSAIWRHYIYLIHCSEHPPALFRSGVTWVYHQLDVPAMQAAARFWLGEQDFSAFRGAGCQARHARRFLMNLDIEQVGTSIVFSVRANAFVMHMVRNLVGTLLKIGRGEKTIDWAKTVLASRDRRQAGQTAPAAGLYLYRVGYPSKYGLPLGPYERWNLFPILEQDFERDWQVEYELV